MTAAHLVVGICAVIATQSSAQDTQPPDCKRFDQIYKSGKELCENMWGSAFKYESDEDKAYTMWFFDSKNPNDQTARSLGKLGAGDHEQCHLQYFHKDKPGPEPDTFTECHPWKSSACCAHNTVETSTKLKEGYGAEYHWDRCGPISQECERFFVQEACFYECDPNAGLYRKYDASIYNPKCDAYAAEYDESYAKANDCDHNAWQMHDMPIKASYCDAWFAACREDKFCAHDDGDYFSCAALYKQIDESKLEKDLDESKKEISSLKAEKDKLVAQSEESDGLGVLVIMGITVPSVLALVACASALFLVKQEKAGKPIFARLMDNNSAGGQAIGVSHA
jgi:folate receptor